MGGHLEENGGCQYSCPLVLCEDRLGEAQTYNRIRGDVERHTGSEHPDQQCLLPTIVYNITHSLTASDNKKSSFCGSV